MSDFEPFSVRQKRLARSGAPVVYQYDPIPKEMRAQAFHALAEALGPMLNSERRNSHRWAELEKAIMREHGFLERVNGNGSYSLERIRDYMATKTMTEQFLDVVEIGFHQAQVRANEYRLSLAVRKELSSAIGELNKRFGQHDLGYRFLGDPGYIVVQGSQYIHAEVVEPAIALLHAQGWQGPLDEFMNAHREYRHGNNKGAMNEALKAFESTMKSVLHARNLSYDPNWTASPLINALISNGVIPPTLQNFQSGIKSVLESGVPTLRNKQSGHGQGPEIANVPDHVAAFALHLAAANIVFLVSQHLESGSGQVVGSP